MIKKIIHRLLRHRHFWRDIGFDELSELYISMMFRSLSMSLIGIFVPIYLLELGYSLSEVLGYIVAFFAIRVVMDVAAGYLVGRIGPKHTMLISYAIHIVAAFLYITLPEISWPLFIPAFLSGASNSIFFVAYHTDFSKVKHPEHGGKELGYAVIIEKLGGVAGPLVGGVVATLFGAQYTFLVSVLLLLLGSLPLTRTAEPTRIHQYVNFNRLPVRRVRRDLLSYAALSVENNLAVNLWPLYLTLFVIGDGVYAKVGALASLAVISSILGAQAIGKLVDRQRGGTLLNYAAAANAGLQLFKPFVRTLPVASWVGAINELASAGFRLPFTKGWYDRADQLPGQRIAYIVITEVCGSAAKLLVWTAMYGLSLFLEPRQLFVTGFVVTALASLGIISQKFPALRYTRR